ncbi:MAG: hypothetical protein DRQ64_00185 [Gammaproteobacteria bacterium]|nr:MAG: hypothetical protein DRQ64_00185 [Gammaproteobacteria bacterium]
MGKKKNKTNDVAEYLTVTQAADNAHKAQTQAEENRTIEVQTEMIGRGFAFVLDTIIKPVLPAVIKGLKASAYHQRAQVELERGRQEIEKEKLRAAERRLKFDKDVQERKQEVAEEAAEELHRAMVKAEAHRVANGGN